MHLVHAALACAPLLVLAACSSEPEPPRADDAALLALGLNNAVVFAEGRASAGQPTPEQLASLPTTGWRRVIGLRPADEPGTGWEEARAAELGIEYVRLPVAGVEGLNETNARALAAVFAAKPGEPTLVVCGSGNRVGGLIALEAHYVGGAAPEEALALGQRAGLTSAEPAVRETLGLPAK